ncbi:hypothetical protein CPB84DRAFT_1749029 [Gymnopilus junonius]|uniref:Uncharacterized protein n=1 Tax=Gymnopilus junonius TaxID=109634 RepID=A0A9P5NIP9_GYMJU|nr:hypothetical protein CPB84DRAFT_1749029 [Gymnopilus junonius]
MPEGVHTGDIESIQSETNAPYVFKPDSEEEDFSNAFLHDALYSNKTREEISEELLTYSKLRVSNVDFFSWDQILHVDSEDHRVNEAIMQEKKQELSSYLNTIRGLSFSRDISPIFSSSYAESILNFFDQTGKNPANSAGDGKWDTILVKVRAAQAFQMSIAKKRVSA